MECTFPTLTFQFPHTRIMLFFFFHKWNRSYSTPCFRKNSWHFLGELRWEQTKLRIKAAFHTTVGSIGILEGILHHSFPLSFRFTPISYPTTWLDKRLWRRECKNTGETPLGKRNKKQKGTLACPERQERAERLLWNFSCPCVCAKTSVSKTLGKK